MPRRSVVMRTIGAMTEVQAVIAVPVACGWRSPDAPRLVDAPSLGASPDIPAWVADMDDDEKRDLVGRLDTQALLGERVTLLETIDGWVRVAVPDQPATASGEPYECWIRADQLVPGAPPRAADGRVATVVSPVARLDAPGSPLEVSFGTSLPVVAVNETTVTTTLPGGGLGVVRAADVVVHAAGSPALRPVADSIVERCRAFVGLPYLWAGRSGFGFDCSGLVQLVHRVHGITLPRDTGPMSEVGAVVARDDRAPGDLVFFERNGDVHHVVTWLGEGLVVESPKTGLAARVIRLDDLPYASEVTVVRRVLPDTIR